MKLRLRQSYPGCGIGVGECIEFPDEHTRVCKYVKISEFYHAPYMSTSFERGCATFDKVGDEYYKVTWNINELLQYPHLWEVIKTPLFITEDGCPVFKGNLYYYVTGIWSIHEVKSANEGNGKTKEFIYFGNRINAEEYVRLNKPRYSVKEINNVLDRVVIGIASATAVKKVKEILGLDN